MKKMQQLLLGSVLAITILLVGCGSTAHVEKDKTVNFKQFKTYAWAEPASTTDKPYKKGSLAWQTIHETVDKELSKQGWNETKNNPDVLLSYDVVVERSSKKQSDAVYSNPFYRTFYNPYYRRYYSVYYPSQFLGYDNYTVGIREGTITVTMTDTKTDKMIWQGWATNEVDNKNLSGREIESTVKSIFRKFDVAKK